MRPWDPSVSPRYQSVVNCPILMLSCQRDLITYMFDCATRNKELGNFGIKELMLDPKTLLKSYVFEQMPLFGQVNVLHGNTLDRLER